MPAVLEQSCPLPNRMQSSPQSFLRRQKLWRVPVLVGIWLLVSLSEDVSCDSYDVCRCVCLI